MINPATTTELWDGHAPSPFDYQALLVFCSGKTRLYQFPKSYSAATVIARAQQEATWCTAVAFLVRDNEGRVIHRGPVVNALGQPLHHDWERGLVLAGFGERRAA